MSNSKRSWSPIDHWYIITEKKSADNGGLALAEWLTEEVSFCALARQPARALYTNLGLHPAPHKLTCTVRRQYYIPMYLDKLNNCILSKYCRNIVIRLMILDHHLSAIHRWRLRRSPRSGTWSWLWSVRSYRQRTGGRVLRTVVFWRWPKAWRNCSLVSQVILILAAWQSVGVVVKILSGVVLIVSVVVLMVVENLLRAD